MFCLSDENQEKEGVEKWHPENKDLLFLLKGKKLPKARVNSQLSADLSRCEPIFSLGLIPCNTALGLQV